MSQATSDRSWPDGRALLSATPPPDGYSPSGAIVRRTLDTFEPVEIRARRGRCYAIRFALGADARFSAHARRGVRVNYHSDDRPIDSAAGAGFGTNLPLSKRSATAVIGCPESNTSIRVDLEAFFGSSVNAGQLHDLGSGEIVARVYSRRIGRRELAQRAADRAHRQEQTERENAAHLRENCGRCTTALLYCGDTDPHHCQSYLECLRPLYIRPAQCLDR